jgi:hypothetical protein
MQELFSQTEQQEQLQQPSVIISEETSQKVFEVLEKTNLNWSVRKEDLITQSGLQTPNAGVFRNDNDEWLGTVSKKYTPYQNAELITTLVEASDYIGLNIDKGGFLNNGKRVYVQLQLPDEYIGNSSVKRYITALNSHNGLSSIAFGSTNTVVKCSNSFLKVYNELEKFRHTSTANEKVKAAIMEMKNTIIEDNNLMETFKTMSTIDLKDEAMAKVMINCFAVDLDADKSKISSRKLKTIQTISNCIETEIKLEGNNLWGLFNGITRYTNHHATSLEKKNDYIMTGQGYITNVRAFNTIMDWISKNTAEEIQAAY